MLNEFTSIEQDGEWFVAYSPEIPSAEWTGTLARGRSTEFGRGDRSHRSKIVAKMTCVEWNQAGSRGEASRLESFGSGNP